MCFILRNSFKEPILKIFRCLLRVIDITSNYFMFPHENNCILLLILFFLFSVKLRDVCKVIKLKTRKDN